MFPATMQNYEQRKRNATKGAAIKLAGFRSGTDALPEDIKEKLDLMLRCKYSPHRILSELSQRFPDVNLPSKSALYNYRKRFFEQSIVSATPVVRAEQEFDVEKVKLKSASLTQIKRFVAFDLPTLRERWVTALERDEHLLLPGTKDIGRLYMDAVKLGLDTIPKLNINLASEVELNDKKDEEVDQEWIDDALLDLLNKRGPQIKIRLENRKALREAERGKALESQVVI